MDVADVTGKSWQEYAEGWQSQPDAEVVAARLARRCNILLNAGRYEEARLLAEIAFMENASMGDFAIVSTGGS